jgi:hypothetical protein
MNARSSARLRTGFEAFFLLLLTCWIAHYLFFEQFRIYEDDYIHSLPQMTWTGHDLRTDLSNVIIDRPEARPLSFFINDLASYYLLHGGSVQAGYLAGLLLITVNSFLLYLFLSREFGELPAIAGAIVYLLYPADTCRQILMHLPFLHLDWSLLLAALLLYQARRPIIAFLVVSLCLISYESFYLPFLFAPLICVSHGRLKLRRLAWHTLAFFLIAGLVFGLRSVSGEERAGLVIQDIQAVPFKILQACIEGPIVTGQLLFTRPLDALLHAEPAEYLAGFMFAAICIFFLKRMRTAVILKSNLHEPFGSTVAARWKVLRLAILGGLLAWAFSYFLSFREGYFPPVVTIGRLTAVHAVGELGIAVLVAGLFAIWFPVGTRNAVPVLSLSVYFGLLKIFGLHIQSSEYVTQGEEQAVFWRTIMQNSGDLGPDDVVLFEQATDPVTAPVTPGFPPFGELNYFPLGSPVFAKSATDPAGSFRIFGLWPNCGFEDTPEGRLLHTPVWAPTLWPVLKDHHFIYFKMGSGQLRRISQPVDILGKLFTPIPQPAELPPPLPETKLFQHIFGEQKQSNWFTIQHAHNYP